MVNDATRSNYTSTNADVENFMYVSVFFFAQPPLFFFVSLPFFNFYLLLVVSLFSARNSNVLESNFMVYVMNRL